MTDIVPELLEKIQKDFFENLEKNKTIKEINKLVEAGNATYLYAEKYAAEVGKALAESFKKNISDDVLPDGHMYYNIAERILNTTLKENHKIISNFTAIIQEELNRKAKLGIKAIKPKVNQDRIDSIINRVSTEPVYSNVSWILNEPVVVFSVSVVDEFIEENAKFHYKSGLSPRIVRVPESGACKWCRSLAGTYKYPDVPKDVYRRHNFCRCVVEYTPGDGKWQNVHNKKWKEGKLDVERKLAIRNGKMHGIKMSGSKGVETRVLQRMDNELHKVQKEFPDVKVDNIIFANEIGEDIARASINIKTLETKLKLNIEKLGTEESMKILENNVSDTLSPKEGLIGYLRHEYIHFQEYQIAIKNNTKDGVVDVSKAMEEIDSSKYAREIMAASLNACDMERNYIIIENNISTYATMNDSEAIAEAYSSCDSDNKLCNSVKKIVRKKWGVK